MRERREGKDKKKEREKNGTFSLRLSPHFQNLTRQRLELDADREPALQLGQHVAGLARREGTGADEEHVIRIDVAVLGRDDAAFDDRQEVALKKSFGLSFFLGEG